MRWGSIEQIFCQAVWGFWAGWRIGRVRVLEEQEAGQNSEEEIARGPSGMAKRGEQRALEDCSLERREVAG
jgi:hypothetical protein